MARYYFHLRDGGELVTDDEGVDLPDLSAAKREAIQAARELLADAIRAGKTRVPEAYVIADEAGRALETIHLASILPEPLKR